MKTNFLIPILILIMAGTNCKKDEKDNNDQLALLYLLTSKSAADQTSDITTPVGQATSVSSAISGISSSVTTSSNSSSFTMKGKNPIEREEMLAMNAVLKYGKDAKVAKNAILQLFKKQRELARPQTLKSEGSKRLTAWSSSSTDSDGYTSYTFSGTVKGAVYTKTEVDYTSVTSGSSSCKISAYTNTNKTDQGTAKFTNGSFKTKSSGSSSSSTGSTTSTKTSAEVSFSSFGTLYTDLYKAIALLKKYSANSGLGSGKPDCTFYKTYIEDFMNTYNQATISGDMSYSTDSNYVIKLSGSTSTITGTFVSTSNSTSGLSISQNGQSVSNVTMKDLKFTATSDYSYVSNTYSGKYTINIVGTVSGSAINETITVNF